jgi:hypothetical protein
MWLEGQIGGLWRGDALAGLTVAIVPHSKPQHFRRPWIRLRLLPE